MFYYDINRYQRNKTIIYSNIIGDIFQKIKYVYNIRNEELITGKFECIRSKFSENQWFIWILLNWCAKFPLIFADFPINDSSRFWCELNTKELLRYQTNGRYGMDI